MTYDSRCWDIAEVFLQDHPHLWTDMRVAGLANIIQQAIEDYIAREHDNYEPPDPPGFEGGFCENH